MPKPSSHELDSTPHSAVIICKRKGCAWRGLAHTRASAWRLFAAHLRRAHKDYRAEQVALRNSRNDFGVVAQSS